MRTLWLWVGVGVGVGSGLGLEEAVVESADDVAV